MKKIALIMLILTLVLITGCQNYKRNSYYPNAKNDKVYTTVSGENEKAYGFHSGEGYTITVPAQNYRYEKDYDDGNLEEKWEYIKRDDVEIKVTTYKNTDEITARNKFLRDNNDYIFEDLTGYPLCGTEFDGDSLWFHLYEANGNVYIISWEYPKYVDDSIKTELSDIASTFKLEE